MSTKRIVGLERDFVRLRDEYRASVDALVGQVNALERKLEKFEAAGTVKPVPPAPAGKKAKIPERPAIMKEAGVGVDPKKG